LALPRFEPWSNFKKILFIEMHMFSYVPGLIGEVVPNIDTAAETAGSDDDVVFHLRHQVPVQAGPGKKENDPMT
jgi:hypothetical protein